MGSCLFLSMFIALLLLLVCHPLVTCRRPPLCHPDESFALLQFQGSFTIDVRVSADPFAYPKTESWKLKGEQSDCCSWDGVHCHNVTGHVTSLDLGSSCLYGSINSNSTLFQLVHLRHLNLADNDFDSSQIPSELAHLSKLKYLKLSRSGFSGQIPASISDLSKLNFLDLSTNHELVLSSSDFGSLAGNLTGLEELNLGEIRLSFVVPHILANVSSLKSLILYGCGLYGKFPVGVFQLPNLQNLVLSFNSFLEGHFPEFNSSSPLESLVMSHTSFSGELPASIGNLGSLSDLNIWGCHFFGHIPASLGNLTQLVVLVLSYNNFESQNSSSLSWVAQKTQLSVLSFSMISLNGEIPAYFANLTQLWVLVLGSCQITGQIPSWLMKMDNLQIFDLSYNELQGPIPVSISQLIQLKDLRLSGNNLQGPIPASIFQLKNLELLSLDINNLSGTVELNLFFKLEKLNQLFLSGNKLTVHSQLDPNSTSSKFHALGLGSCNLNQFPLFLRDQDQLNLLDLSSNNIHGPIPRWLWSMSKDTLFSVDLSRNFLRNFELYPAVLPWSRVWSIDLSSNMLQGSLPIPLSSSTFEYFAFHNNFTGEISPLICSLKSLHALDLSDNHLSGMLPKCLENFGPSFEILNLRRNKFQGMIPQPRTKNCNLKMLVLDNNQLKGKVPRSLANCPVLEFLILGNNQIKDVFPSWLGSLQQLKVLILRANQFHDVVGGGGPPQTNFEFPKLRIIDLSQNNFSGQLPTNYFLNWNAMKIAEVDRLAYMAADLRFFLREIGLLSASNISYSITINNKGMNREYVKILEFFVAIDLSNNRFEGKIPQVIGEMKGLRSLNLANNVLTGQIPSSLGDLSELESLDLSQNKLLGNIPQELTELNFLSFFNVSHNRLIGSIPQGKQFATFDDSSFEGNSGLCGNPLSKKCETAPAPQSFGEVHDSGSPFEFGWKPVAMGYASGFVIGAIIGQVVFKKKPEWIVKLFGAKQQTVRRIRARRSRRHRN